MVGANLLRLLVFLRGFEVLSPETGARKPMRIPLFVQARKEGFYLLMEN